jgi:hypothetical protein
MLPENIYTTGVTYDNCHMTIEIQSTGRRIKNGTKSLSTINHWFLTNF